MTAVDDDAVGGEVVSEIGPWAMVPVWVLSKGLKPAELATYVALRSFADQGGAAHPRAEKIADRACLSVGTVRNCIQGLRKKGLLATTERRRPDGSLAGLVYRLFDVDPRPGQAVESRRTGEKPGPKPGQKSRSATGTSGNADPSIATENTGAGTSGNAGGLHQVMQGSAPANAGKNTPEEHPTGTPSDPASQDRRGDGEIGDDVEGQITIDGNVEAPPVKEATAHDLAMKIAREWVAYRKRINKPVGARRPEAQVGSLVGTFVLAGYTEDEIKRALNGIGEGYPSNAQMQRALDTIRDRKQPGANGRPQQRGAAADVNAHWRQRNGGDLVGAGSTSTAPRAAAIRTDGAFWED